MRLLQVTIRSLLLYALILVLVSIPVSMYSIRAILEEEVDEALLLQTDQFLKHVKNFESLDDIETDLDVFDHLSYNINIRPTKFGNVISEFNTIVLYDSIENEPRPFRQLSSSVDIKGKPYLLIIRMSLLDNDELVFAIGSVQALLIALLAAGLLFLNRSLTKKLWKPFYNTLEQLKAYELGKHEPFLPEKSNIIEFDDLNKTAIHLVNRNRKIFLEQKEFIENASHELQTPLAIFQSKLDNLMQSKSMSESDAATISELEETALRMSKLNKNLLLLSKIDNQQFADVKPLALSHLIRTLLHNVASITESKGIVVEMALGTFTIQANAMLIEILLSNLLNNAIKHTAANGFISVKLDGATFTLSNSGSKLKMNKDKMFERFSKEGAVDNSTGLGLAIVKKICDSCKYPFDYHFIEGNHVFTVIFNH